MQKLSPKERARIKLRNSRIRSGVTWGVFALCALIVLVTAASFWRSFGLVWGTGDAVSQRVYTLGMVTWRFRYSSQTIEGAGAPPPGLHFSVGPANSSLWTSAGGTVVSRTRGSMMFFHALIVLGIAGLSLAAYEEEQRRNARRGCCRVCGYSLKGLEPIDFRTTCPECGEVRRHRRRKKPSATKPSEPVVATGQ